MVPHTRSATIGAATGVLITGLIASPLGRRSGRHFNAAVTAAFWMLRAIPTLDALAYVVAQLLGSVAGVLLGRLILGAVVAGPAVRYAAIQPAPGWSGVMVFTGEAVSAFVLMAVVVYFLTQSRRARWTPAAVGVVVGILIVAGGASSGGSFNPARQFGPALLAHEWRHLVSYLAGPVAGAAILALIARAVFWTMVSSSTVERGTNGPPAARLPRPFTRRLGMGSIGPAKKGGLMTHHYGSGWQVDQWLVGHAFTVAALGSTLWRRLRRHRTLPILPWTTHS